MSPSKTDVIFSNKHSQVKDFTFDAQVVEVFPDMISRSVPGYNTIIDTIGLTIYKPSTTDKGTKIFIVNL